MRLRARLTLATLLVTVPLAVCLLRVDRGARHDAARVRLRSYTESRMEALRAECESSPETFGGELRGHGEGAPPKGPPPFREPPDYARREPPRRARPAVVFAYDASLRSRNPRAPALSAELVNAMVRGADEAEGDGAFGDDVVLLVRTPWRDGPCAFALARGTTDPAWGALLPDSQAWLLPTLAVFIAMLIATGPFVARVRTLTREVGRAREQGYVAKVSERGSDELAELARAFNAAGAEVTARLAERDARERALREFVSNTTHDVMLPLTVLQGHLAALRERVIRGGPLRGEDVLPAMDEAHYMASLLRDLRVSARLDAGEAGLVRSPFDLGVLVRRVVARHATIAKEHDVALECAVPEDHDPIVLLADETLVEQAVSNVVYNAVRYNNPGGHVAVVLEASGAERFSLEVTDDGIGMSDEELARIAQRGFRGKEARSRRPDGQGIGLHIASQALSLSGLTLEFAHASPESAPDAPEPRELRDRRQGEQERSRRGVSVRIAGPRRIGAEPSPPFSPVT